MYLRAAGAASRDAARLALRHRSPLTGVAELSRLQGFPFGAHAQPVDYPVANGVDEGFDEKLLNAFWHSSLNVRCRLAFGTQPKWRE